MISRGIGREIVKSLRGDKLEKNPLLTIGISQTILDLGLTQDELFEECRRFVVRLVARAHPDVSHGEDRPAARELTEALGMLRNREVFNRAVEELREMHAYTSANERTLMMQLDRTKQEVKQAQNEQRAMRSLLVGETRYHDWATKYTIGDSMRFPYTQGVKSLSECTAMRLALIKIETSSPPTIHAQSELKKLREFYSEVENNNEKNHDSLLPEDRGHMREVIEDNRLDAKLLAPYIRQALSEESMPSIRWSDVHVAENFGFSKLIPRGRSRLNRTSKSAQGSWAKEQILAYRRTLEGLASFAESEGLYVREVDIQPRSITFENRMILEGRKRSPLRFYVLGSVELTKAFQYSQKSMGAWLSLSEDILPEVEPFVAPGAVLVTRIAPQVTEFRESGPGAFSRAQQERRTVSERLRTAHSLTMSHVVIGVE